MSGSRQLAFDLPHRAALGRDDFLVSGSNAAAVAAMDAWPSWPHSGLVLVGPAGSGKSHLVEVWQNRSGARRIMAGDVTGDPEAAISGAAAIAIEDCDARIDETAFFHLLNAIERSRIDVLLSARKAPAHWGIGLSDLRSRLGRLPVVSLLPPDDILLRALMVKLFSDRQLIVEASTIGYLAARIERSYSAAREIVDRLDRAAIETKGPVTRALAGRILAQYGELDL